MCSEPSGESHVSGINEVALVFKFGNRGLHLYCVPQNCDADYKSEHAKLVFLTLLVVLTYIAFASVENSSSQFVPAFVHRFS